MGLDVVSDLGKGNWKEEGSTFESILTAVEKHLERTVYVDPGVLARLAEYMALKRSRPSANPKSILCLTGPPGMGKGLIVRSLCEALGWRLIRIPVGEIRHEDETLLGRRRADLNATAGRIIHALQAMGVEEAIVLLEGIDRIDLTGVGKGSADFFEVLDYVQDYAIKNNYLHSPLDLSKVVFMATANNVATVPPGVREWMEILPLPSYTEEEKLKIARRYLIPDLAESYSLQKRVELSEKALRTVVRRYTREAGVAELRTNLKTLFRAGLKSLEREGGKGRLRISTRNLRRYLGPPRFFLDPDHEKDEIGRVTVLGKSEKGGWPLILELLVMKGEGKLMTTGNTDKMFQESAWVALDYIRSQHERFGIEEDFYRQYDFHLHLPEATVPKYGVSAGLAIVTALVSGLTGRPVRRKVGMTGEITLHGKVLGVGDVRDKVLGAYQAELKAVFIPKENEGAVANLPSAMKREMRIVAVESVETVLREAIVWDGEEPF